jgi:hypothetical protein
MRLWRPVGASELALIEQSGWRRFPPRLSEQPFFYPVLSFEYAEQIARDWNARGDDEGFIVTFEVDDDVAAKYPPQTVGAAALHRELWVPADDLAEFNEAIRGKIELVARYRNGARVEDQR